MMLNFPPPPQPPIDVSQLESLADYYRSLADYYRRASEIATQQLTHVEALLHPNELLAFSEENDFKGWLETQTPNGSSIPQLSAGQESQPHLSIPKPQEDKPSQPDESNQKTNEELFALLATELETNRGKMLHLDYLVREIHGAIALENLESARVSTRSLLEKGAAQQKWFAVPDAPDCWTIDLTEFPDLAERKTETKRSSSHAARTTLIGSDILDRYATVTEAIAVCLKEHYPNSMNTKQIADYFYPEGLSDSRRQKVHGSLSNALSEGNNGLWRRVKVGQYIWKES